MRIEFLNLPVDVLSLPETVERAVESMRSRTRLQHVAINVAKIVKARSDPELRDDIVTSDLVGIDGMGVVLGLRLAGVRGVQRAAGIDLMNAVLERCAAEGFRPFFLGSRPEVVTAAAATACQRYPGLAMAGVRDGYFAESDEDDVVASIRASKADCLFVGLPTPRKERLLAKYRDALDVPFIMGVGGSFDVLAGLVNRAPAWMQKRGLEWLYRVYQEPGRLWWRYASTNAAYALLVCRVVARRIAAGRLA